MDAAVRWYLEMKSRSLVFPLFVLPAVVFTVFAFVLPLLGVLRQSLLTDSGQASVQAYVTLFHSRLFYLSALNTLAICAIATVATLLIAYPMAYYLAGATPKRRSLLMILVLIPFWTSILVKSFAFTVLLGEGGVVNHILGWFGIGPIKLLFNQTGVVIGMSHFLIPFMVFPILSSLLARPPELVKAARIMGASNTRIFFRIVLPLSMPGVAAGALMVLILSLGFFIVPAMLGGSKNMMLGNLVDFYTRESLNAPMASAISMVLLVVAVMAAVAMAKIPGGSNLLGGEEAGRG